MEELEGSTQSGGSSTEHSPSESPIPDIPEDQICDICCEKFKQPRILSCLHIFCTECLEAKLSKETSEGEEEGGETKQQNEITCEKCQQVTPLTDKGVSDLSLDHVLVNILDMSAIEDTICTSCKAKEKAVARCSDCANFLCPNCVTAHQYMRCFENHKVVSFEDMQNGEGLAFHKPLFCVSHPAENMKYFCNTCQVPICNECMIVEHKQPEHSYERINDVEEKQRAEIQSIVTEAKDKIDVGDKATCDLQSYLSELEGQSDQAKGLIEETFQSYKAILDIRKAQVLEELEKLHKDQELSIMESINKVEKSIEKIEDGTGFSERVMEHGNLVEILLMKRVISSQLLSLINNTVKPDVHVGIEFVTDIDKFEEAVKTNFGHFKKDNEEELLKTQEATAASLHSSFENEGINLPPGLLNHDSAVLSNVTPDGDFLADLPLSLGNINVSVSPLAAAGVSPQTINSIATSLQNLSGVGNERSSSRNSYSPAMSDSGISVDAASNGSSYNQQPAIDVGALAKHGTISVNGQGQITLNGQVLPGLTVNNVIGLPSSLMQLSNRSTTPTTPAVEASLSNLFGGLGVNTSRSVTPSLGAPTTPLGDISSLLASSTTPALSSLPSLGGSTPNLISSGILGTGGLPLTPSHFNFHSHHGLPARNANKMSAMQIKCKFGQLGPGKGQFNSPHGFCMGLEEDIIVADTNNHRVQVFEKSGEFKYQFGIPGKEEGQLWYPRKVAVIRTTQKYVVCDRGNERSRMQVFTKNGHFVKKIAIRYIDIVAGLAITTQGYIVAVDSVSPTVFVINPETATGDLIRWFDCSDYMREPSDIAVSGKEYFVCDFKGHCVVVFNEDGQFVRRIGCENITNFPNGIDISDAGDVLIGDSHGNRFHVAVFQRDGSLIGEFECPYVKVSRCCGLKITLEGYIVTLAKNNHHVLVLHTLYID